MKRALKIVAVIVAILVVIALILPFVINANSFRPQIESQLTSALGRKVSIGNIDLSIWSGSLSADDIAIADDSTFSSSPFVRAKSLSVGVELMPLIFSKALHVTELTLKSPQVALIRARSGKWNFSSLGASSPATNQPTPAANPSPTRPQPGEKSQPSSDQSMQNLSVGKLSIRDGLISISDSGSSAKSRVYKNVDVTVKDFSFISQFPFTL